MAITRSGLVKPVLVVCLKPLTVNGASFEVGKTYELVLNMGSMFVVKTANGLDAMVPKDSFELAKE